MRGIRWACTLRGRPGTYRGALRPITRDARLPALHRGDFRLRSHASFSGISSGSVQRAPRSQVVVPGGRGPVPPGTTVVSRRRGTPRLAPPSGSSPEMPLMSEAKRAYNMDAFCSQVQNEFNFSLRYERLKAFQVSGLARARTAPKSKHVVPSVLPEVFNSPKAGGSGDACDWQRSSDGYYRLDPATCINPN